MMRIKVAPALIRIPQVAKVLVNEVVAFEPTILLMKLFATKILSQFDAPDTTIPLAPADVDG